MLLKQAILLSKEKNYENLYWHRSCGIWTKRKAFIVATGQGEAITANKFPNVRAVVYYGKSESVVDDEADVIIRSRQHNDANILSLGARYLTEEEMMNVVNLWLKTSYSGDERHVRRLGKIDQIHE